MSKNRNYYLRSGHLGRVILTRYSEGGYFSNFSLVSRARRFAGFVKRAIGRGEGDGLHVFEDRNWIALKPLKELQRITVGHSGDEVTYAPKPMRLAWQRLVTSAPVHRQ